MPFIAAVIFTALAAGLFLASAWVIMLLVDPATAGSFTISFGQAVAITALLTVVGQVLFTQRSSK